MPCSDSPSPPPGLCKPSLVAPMSVAGLTARSPFEGAATESQSLFSDNSNFRHPNPVPSSLPGFPSSPHSGGSEWPTAPEPQSLFASGKADRCCVFFLCPLSYCCFYVVLCSCNVCLLSDGVVDPLENEMAHLKGLFQKKRISNTGWKPPQTDRLTDSVQARSEPSHIGYYI